MATLAIAAAPAPRRPNVDPLAAREVADAMFRRMRSPSRQLADLLGDVKAWARHQRLPELAQAMTEAQALAGRIGTEAHHG